MTHQQLLNKLAAKSLVQAIDEDLSRLIIRQRNLAKHDEKIRNTMRSTVLSTMLARWNCALLADKTEVTDSYKQTTVLTLTILFHKYGFAYPEITQKAIKAIDQLNKAVALSDDFFRKSSEIKDFISTEPTPLQRNPKSPDHLTFYRPQDVISIQLDNQYFCAYIHSNTRFNESPIIEFYDKIFDIAPHIADLKSVRAKGQVYNDGIERISKYSVSGIKFSPDPAHQIQLMGSAIETPPSNTHIMISDWQFTVSDIFTLQNDIRRTFEK